MQPHEIYALKTNVPFAPFAIQTISNGTYEIDRSDMVAVGKTMVVVGVRNNRDSEFADRFEFILLNEIVALISA